MKSLVFLTVIIIPGVHSLKCYSCATNNDGLNIIRIYPPLFNVSFFASMAMDHACEDDRTKQIKDDCKSFCVSEYIHQTINGVNQTMLFRACANDVLVGAIDYALNMNCSGKVHNYTTQGYPLGNSYYATGNGFACNWDLCNHQTQKDLQSKPQKTCKPCDYWNCPDNKCISNDGYTAQCNCSVTYNSETGNNVNCGSKPKLKSTTSTTTTTASTTTATTTSTTTSTSTTTYTTSTSSTSTTSTTTSASTTSTTSTATTTTDTQSTTTSTSATTSTTSTTASTTTSATTTSITTQKPLKTDMWKWYWVLIAIYAVFFVLLIVFIIVLIMYRRSVIELRELKASSMEMQTMH